ATRKLAMTGTEFIAEQFEANRSHLRGVAYRMLGSLSEADDAVQEAWLRLSRSDTSGVQNLAGWLTTVVARVSLDMLRSRKAKAEEALGEEGAEPVVSSVATGAKIGGASKPEKEEIPEEARGVWLPGGR